MSDWRKLLKYDPIPPLLSSGDEALRYYVHRDLLGMQVGPIESLWELPAPKRILKKQLDNGAWPQSGKKKHAAINYELIETWRQFRFLVEQYGFTRQHPQALKAAEFLFSCQTREGDFRGILANQYATYYSGAIMALLINAGFADDPRIELGFQWLLGMRQEDLGWTIPILTHKLDRETQYHLTSEFAEPLEPDRSKPFSHNWTGMVLRAFVAHPSYRHHEAAMAAAELLKSRFFQPDYYTSYQKASYWVRFEYPFWWNNLVSTLDSLSLLDYSMEDEQIMLALDWLVDHQQEDSLWKLSYVDPQAEEKLTPKITERKLWVSLAICRIFERFYV